MHWYVAVSVLNVALHLLSMYFLEQCGRSNALFFVFKNSFLWERFWAWLSMMSFVTLTAAAMGSPVISCILSFSTRYLACFPISLWGFPSEIFAISLNKGSDISVMSKLNPYGILCRIKMAVNKYC